MRFGFADGFLDGTQGFDGLAERPADLLRHGRGRERAARAENLLQPGAGGRATPAALEVLLHLRARLGTDLVLQPL